MNKILFVFTLLFLFIFIPSMGYAQSEEPRKLPGLTKGLPYNPYENADEKINGLIEKAQKENKNIILQAGGNWCVWCVKFDNYWKEDDELQKMVMDNFLYYHLNYSAENKNKDVFDRLGNPEELGFPVFVVLDSNGKQLYTESVLEFMEETKFVRNKVMAFFEKWKPSN